MIRNKLYFYSQSQLHFIRRKKQQQSEKFAKLVVELIVQEAMKQKFGGKVLNSCVLKL